MENPLEKPNKTEKPLYICVCSQWIFGEIVTHDVTCTSVLEFVSSMRSPFTSSSLVSPFKCCYNNIILPCGHWRQPPMTQKRLPSLGLWNNFRLTNVGELPEVKATAGGCGNCWKLWRAASKAPNVTENAIFIFIVIFSYNSNKPRP